jgi:hypothetical protein
MGSKDSFALSFFQNDYTTCVVVLRCFKKIQTAALQHNRKSFCLRIAAFNLKDSEMLKPAQTEACAGLKKLAELLPE